MNFFSEYFQPITSSGQHGASYCRGTLHLGFRVRVILTSKCNAKSPCQVPLPPAVQYDAQFGRYHLVCIKLNFIEPTLGSPARSRA